MGVSEARRYIQDLRKKQKNPYLWPDFLTGLPDKAAILARLEEVYPKLGRYAVAYVRIANIHPYLIKYGPDRHAEIIQWAAAILKTTSDRCANSFVGTLSTHDFVIMCETKHLPLLLKEAGTRFRKKAESFYSAADLAKKETLSFSGGRGEKVSVGLMGLMSVIADKKLPIPRSQIIQRMGKICEAMEDSGEDTILMDDAMVSGE